MMSLGGGEVGRGRRWQGGGGEKGKEVGRGRRWEGGGGGKGEEVGRGRRWKGGGGGKLLSHFFCDGPNYVLCIYGKVGKDI